MKSKVNVVLVNEAPAIGKPEMMGGIRSKEEAANWADKHGYGTVYLWVGRQRVYADKLTKKVEVLAEQIQTKSDHLVVMAEAGQGLAECVIIAALVVIVLVFVCHSWPW